MKKTKEPEETIEDITSDFGFAYKEAKVTAKVKDDLQKRFFQAATAELEKTSLAQKVVEFDNTKYTPLDWVATYHPGWRFAELHQGGDNLILIEENPALLPYIYVNKRDKIVYARTTSSGSPQLDDERLRQDDPDLWNEISQWPEPWLSLVTNAFKSLNILNPEEQAQIFLQDQGVQRTLKPIESLDDDQLVSLQEYLVPAPIAVRLVPPRLAKEDEL